jgi:hypothetical protein
LANPEKELAMRLSTNTLLSIFLYATVSMSQDVQVNGNSSQPYVFQSTNTSTASADRPALYGISKPNANYGIGVRGEGSYTGVYALANGTGGGTRFGVNANASGASGNYAYLGSASGGNQNYGAYVGSSGGTFAIGIYAYASGASVNYAGYFAGNLAYTGTLSQSSDEKLKTNIKSIDSGLSLVGKLKPKKYKMLASDYPNMNLPTSLQYGLLAQDVAAVLPDLVSDVPSPGNSPDGSRTAPPTPDTYKSVNYIGLIPILIKAVQEQQNQITDLQNQIASLKTKSK